MTRAIGRILLLLWGSSALPVLATDFYISPTGSDTTPGTCTLAQPCATFQRCNNVMGPGDTCYAREGEYLIAPDASGPGKTTGWRLFGGGPGPKTFRSYPGEMAVLKPVSYNECDCADLRGDGYGYCNRTPCTNPLTTWPMQSATITLGDARQDNYTFSDLTIYGRFSLSETESPPDWASDDIVLERIIFKCPGSFGNGNCVNIYSGSKNTSDASMGWSVPRDRLTIRNNLFLFDDTCPNYSEFADAYTRYLDGPDGTHLYANKDLQIYNNDYRITSTRLDEQLRHLIVDQNRPPFRFFFWTKGLAEGARVYNNYMRGQADAAISFNSGGCPPSYRNICYEGSLDGTPCTIDADCPGGACRSCGIKGPGEWTSFVYTNGDNRAYNNISDMAGAIEWNASQHGYNDLIYNNTIYRPASYDPLLCNDASSGCANGVGGWFSGTVGRGVENASNFNNIVYSPTTDLLGNYYFFTGFGNFGGTGIAPTLAANDNAKGHVCKQTYLDNNIYYDVDDADVTSFQTTELFDAVDGDGDGRYMETKRFGSLTAWKSYLASTCSSNPSVRETNSREVNPLFADAPAHDFTLQAGSPARTGGRGAGYPSYIGAVDPAGGQTFGCTFDESCYGYDDLGPNEVGTDYYVRPGGDNSHTGLANDDDTAWATPSKCMTTIGAGDRCLITSGEYAESAAATQANAGTMTPAVVASCTCTKGSTAVTCSSAVTGISPGHRVRCGVYDAGNDRFPADPYFAWAPVRAVNGNDITLVTPYAGQTQSGVPLARASFVTFRTLGDAEAVVTSTRKTGAPTFTLHPTAPNVYYYAKAGASAPWNSPLGMREDTEPWDTSFRNRTGKDTYVYLASLANPCTVTACYDQVAKVPGSWCADATNVYVRTFSGGSPAGVLRVQNWDDATGGNGNGTNTFSRNYTVLDGLTYIYPMNPTGVGEMNWKAGLRVGANHTLYQNLRTENGNLRFELGGGRREMDARDIVALDKVTALASGTSANSGLRFYNIEMRGGWSNTANMGDTGHKGWDSSDRIVYDRIYLHRAHSWLQAGNLDCSVTPAAWLLNEEFEASHGMYTGTTADTGGHGSHVLVQNSIVEITFDGFCLMWGATANDIIYRNNTFGWSGSGGNFTGEGAEVGATSAAPGWGVTFVNNTFTKDSVGTAAQWGGGVVFNGGQAAGITSDYNMWVFGHNPGSNFNTSVAWNSFVGGSGDVLFSNVRSAYTQELNSFAVCHSGCSSSTFTFYNDGDDAQAYFEQYIPSDVDPTTDYTPTLVNRGVDAGNNAECPEEDFYGNPRDDGQCDIGAVELQQGSEPPTAPDNVTGVSTTPADGFLTVNWTHSASPSSVGTMVRWKLGSAPASVTDGTLLCNETAAPSTPDSCTHVGLTNGVTYYYTLYAYDEVPNYASGVQTSGVPADTGVPNPPTSFVATPGVEQITLSWVHSSSGDALGTMVRYGTSAYPVTPTDGLLACTETGAPGTADSCVHAGLTAGQPYYYSAFAYDGVPNYSSRVTATGTPQPSGGLPGTFYISPLGSDSNACTNQTTDACASFPRCAAVMSAGDTCYAMDGTYTTTGTNGWYFSIPGGTAENHKKFTSLSQDASKVIIKASDTATQPTYFIQGNIGGSQSDYLEFSYLTIEGKMRSNSPVDGLTYHHNILRCPDIGGEASNSSLIYLSGDNTEMIDDVSIYENRFVMDDSCPNPAGNVAFMVWFNVNGAVVENNDFVNTSTSRTVYTHWILKRANKDTIIRKNYFKSRAGDGHAIWLMDCDGESAVNQFGDRSAYGGSARCNNRIYQNIFVNGHAQIDAYAEEQEWIYNNTYIDPPYRCIGQNVDAASLGSGDLNSYFNNLCDCSGGGCADAAITIPDYGHADTACVSNQSYVDNNLYYPEKSYIAKDCGDQYFSTLAAWKAHLASYAEQNSETGDPLFVDAANGDFHLQGGSPAIGMGRGGDYATTAGAYVTGTEQIGCSFHLSCYSYGASPAVPGAVRGVTIRGGYVK